MWFFKWKKYAVSGTATAVSIIGTVLRYMAMLGVIDMLFVNILGIAWLRVAIFITIGIGCHFAAKVLAFSRWKKWLAASGYEQQIIHGDLEVALHAFNKLPEKKALHHLEILNTSIGAELRRSIFLQA